MDFGEMLIESGSFDESLNQLTLVLTTKRLPEYFAAISDPIDNYGGLDSVAPKYVEFWTRSHFDEELHKLFFEDYETSAGHEEELEQKGDIFYKFESAEDKLKFRGEWSFNSASSSEVTYVWNSVPFWVSREYLKRLSWDDGTAMNIFLKDFYMAL